MRKLKQRLKYQAVYANGVTKPGWEAKPGWAFGTVIVWATRTGIFRVKG